MNKINYHSTRPHLLRVVTRAKQINKSISQSLTSLHNYLSTQDDKIKINKVLVFSIIPALATANRAINSILSKVIQPKKESPPPTVQKVKTM